MHHRSLKGTSSKHYAPVSHVDLEVVTHLNLSSTRHAAGYPSL
jgi:hypothetical protein